MPYSLKGRNVLVIGASRGIGAFVAEKFAAEGSNIAINYTARAEDQAKDTAHKIESEYPVKTALIEGDLETQDDCIKIARSSKEALGGLDVVVSNAGFTKFTTFGDLDGLNEDEWDKCWDSNVKEHLHLFKAVLPTFKENPEGGVFIITSTIAGVAPSGPSMAYSVTKAAGLHLMKCLALTQGPKVRVNAVIPGLLVTDWGEPFGKTQVENWPDTLPLRQFASLDDCADIYPAIAKNSSMTGQTIQVESGAYILGPRD